MSTSSPPKDLNALTEEMNASFAQKQEVSSVQPWSPQLVTTLSISLFSFTALILFLITFIMVNRKLSGIYALKLYIITLIISFSSFLCITGYDSAQLSSIFGLFGAIAGYLLGKDSNVRYEKSGDRADRRETDKPDEKPPAEEQTSS